MHEIHGVRIGVRADDNQILEHLVKRMPPGSTKETRHKPDQVFCALTQVTSGDPQYKLYTNDCELTQTADFDQFLDEFESSVGIYVAENARGLVFVHAGCVGWNGEAIVIPGRSYSGKTTLVKALLRAGATYYSDEYAVLDHKGLVHPYQRPLSVRGEQAARRRIQAEALGATVGDAGIPVGLVIITRYEQGGRWQPRRTTPGQIVMSLLDNTVCARRKPETVLPVLGTVGKCAKGFEGVRGEADEIVCKLLIPDPSRFI